MSYSYIRDSVEMLTRARVKICYHFAREIRKGEKEGKTYSFMGGR